MTDLQPARVSVAIPAYNAAGTIEETLLSVRRQSYAALEIIVVDDGSTDGTAGIVQRHAVIDRRIRLIRQRNGGVSAARNTALAAATGALFATIDADDVWHPEKIARQVDAMGDGGAQTVLSYTWFATIDERGRVLSTAEPEEEGCVVARMCRGNLLGTGSSALMRTDVLREIGGWDVALAGGNEDYKAFFLLAERGAFCLVRDYLVGYRQSRGNRSSKVRWMLESYDQVLAEVGPRHPEHAETFAVGRQELIAYLFDKAVLYRQWRAAGWLLRQAQQHRPRDAAALLADVPLIAGRMLLPLRLKAMLRRSGPAGCQKAQPFLASEAA